MDFSNGGYHAPSFQAVPFAASTRSSRRRRSRLSGPTVLPSACEESAHYPVFNPEDPRHNPAIRTSACLEDANGLSETIQPTGSIRWMQSLPGRSLRRARSGLQALRSGLHRRSGNQSADSDTAINGVWPSSSDSAEGSSEPRECPFSSTVSEASTEEDFNFGTDLYRIGHKYPGFKHELNKDMGTSPCIPCPDPPLVFPVETLPSACPRGALSIAPEAPDMASNDDDDMSAPIGVGQRTETPAATAVPKTVDETIESPVQVRPSNSPLTDSHEIVSPLRETAPVASSAQVQDIAMYEVVAEESTDGCNSNASSSSMLCQVDSHQTPCDEAQTDPEPDGTHTTCVPVVEITRVGSIGGETEPAVGVEEAPVDKPTVTVSEGELGDLMDVDYLLSVDTLGRSEACENKTRDKEPSPNSLSEEQLNDPVSPRLPTEKSDRASLLSLRDEYFLVDGKSTEFRPDRPDTALKGERRFTGDGGMYSGPGLDRNHSIRTHEIPEIVGPGGPIAIPSPRQPRRDREGSDSTDEYLITYSLLHRHYFS
ncbi:hypothetical protein BJX61DRAFT_539893 [Aspergillus egyptiacus]|nr:hypothetical protein BJX61DRAFT_539893 [Aspergillus egyptiacus]